MCVVCNKLGTVPNMRCAVHCPAYGELICDGHCTGSIGHKPCKYHKNDISNQWCAYNNTDNDISRGRKTLKRSGLVGSSD